MIDRCPSCTNLQKRWVIPSYKQENVLVCVECSSEFLDSSSIYQIVTDNVSVKSKTISF